jgi:AcrR family transcriptional regulator
LATPQNKDEAQGGRRAPRTTQAAQIIDALVAAAASTLSSTGSLAALSMRQIARVAGVSIGSVYYYFRNQDELLVRVIDRENEMLADSIRAALRATPASSIADDVATILSELGRWRTTKRWVSKLPVTHLLKGDVLATVLDHSTAIFASFADEICTRNGKRPPEREQTAHVVLYLLAVQSLWALDYPATRDLRASASLLTSFFLQLEDAPPAPRAPADDP